MSFTDFEFNGQRLSDFGCMICSFVSLVAVYLLAKLVTYLFDELRFAIRTLKNNRRKKKNG